jgi:diadenosine tetraphosphate (Ap4A) HIT family hydrolase
MQTTVSPTQAGMEKIEEGWRGCLLCEEIGGSESLSLRLGLYRNQDEKIVLETENFLVIPDISPLVPGHRLLVTRLHYSNFAELRQQFSDELETVQSKAIADLRDLYPKGQVVLFEHGSVGGESKAGACISHAHVHLLPLPENVGLPPFRDWLEDYGKVVEVVKLADIPVFIPPGDANYLFCHDGKTNPIIAGDLIEPVPCQYMRRLIAGHIGVESWNWKVVLHRYTREKKG